MVSWPLPWWDLAVSPKLTCCVPQKKTTNIQMMPLFRRAEKYICALSPYLTELRHCAINLRRNIAKKMRIFTDFCYHSHIFFWIATGLQLICEFIAHNSQTSLNLVANSQCIRKLFSRRSCSIRTNVVRTSHDVRANVAWPSQTSRTNTLRVNCEFSRIYIHSGVVVLKTLPERSDESPPQAGKKLDLHIAAGEF